MGLLAVAALTPLGPANVQFAGLTRTYQGDGLNLIQKGVTSTAWYLYRALATLVPAGPVQAQTVTNLTVTPTIGGLKLNWVKSNIDDVQVAWRKTEGDTFPTNTYGVAVSGTSYTITGLEPCIEYTVRVIPREGGFRYGEFLVTAVPGSILLHSGITQSTNHTFTSSAVCAPSRTPSETQKPPALNVTVTATGRESARVTWGAVGEGSISYDVYYKLGTEQRYHWRRMAQVYEVMPYRFGLRPTAQKCVGSLTPCANIDGLKPGETYTVRVRAKKLILQDNAYAGITMLAQSEVTFTMGGDEGEVLHRAGNTPPVLTDAAAAQTATVGEAFTYTVPVRSVTLFDTGCRQSADTYSAALADGSKLPKWLSFEAKGRTRWGTPVHNYAPADLVVATFSGTPGTDDAPAELVVVMTTSVNCGPSLLAATAWSFALTVQAAGAMGGGNDEGTFDLNNPPIFDDGTEFGTTSGEGAAQTATVDQAFSYTAPAATDREKNAIAYSAALADGSDLPQWLSFNGATRTFSGTPGTGDAPAELVVVMTARDDHPTVPLSSTWSFTLAVQAAGAMGEAGTREGRLEEAVATLPTANAGADQIGKRGGEVKLVGSGSLHAEGSQEPLIYNWRIVDASHAELKAGTSWLSDVDKATATWSVPRRKDVKDRRAVNNGQWIEFELTVSDGDGETATDRVKVTIQGTTWKAVSLSVADAVAEETSGSITFTVSLSAAARDPVTVNYATSNGTALAGVDYTAANGTLTFQPGQTSQPVRVTILDDEHDEGTETFTLTLSNPLPGKTVTLADATATGTIKNEDPLLNAWLSRFGRSVASQTVVAVGERLALPPEAGSHLTLAGQPVTPNGTTADDAGSAATYPYGIDLALGAMTGQDLLLSSNFHLASGNSGTNPSTPWRFAGWGQAGIEHFENRNGGLPVNADVLTGVVGADMARGPWLAGVALSISRGDGEMRPRGMSRTYDLESTMTAINPYLRIQPSQRFSAWGMAGWGWGNLTLTHQQDDNGDDTGFSHTYNTDLSMTLAAIGGRAELLTPTANGGFALALKGDAFFVRTHSDAVAVDGLGRLLEAAEGEASRLRLALEGSRPVTLASDALLTPSLQMGVRQDGGDAESGTGLEVGAALAYDHPASGVSADLKARTLLVHADSGYREWGISGALRMAPGEDNRGLSLSLLPSWGRDVGGIDQLWAAQDAVALAAGSEGFEPTARLEAELGYGLPAFSNRFTGTPYLGLGWADATQSYRIGWRLTPVEDDDSFQFSLEAQRRQSGSQEEAEHQLGFNINTLW